MNKQELIEKWSSKTRAPEPIIIRESFNYADSVLGIYEQGFLDARTEILRDLEQLDEPRKPVVPRSVGALIEFYREKDVTLIYILNCFKEWADTDKEHTDEVNWIVSNPETFMRAWLYGYEVEKEPLYYVRLPFEVWDEDAAELKTEYFYLHYDITSDETRLFTTKKTMKDFVSKLDEATIKSADEKYWAFAVPVKEVEG